MKRIALLIANTNAAGTQTDINNWEQFLKSGTGGAWYSNEICKLVNPSLNQISTKISSIKNSNYDFCVVVYAGHGGWERSTILEINSDGDVINETTLKYLAPREILVLDSCRVITATTEELEKAHEGLFSITDSNSIRAMYENRMMQAVPQQVTLYACSIGESAYGDNSGGYYTKNLLRCCAKIQNVFKTVNQAHIEAAEATKAEVLEQLNCVQTPDISSSRCLSSQQLIIGIDTSHI